MNQPVATSIRYLGRRTGMPRHCRVRSDKRGHDFILYVARPDEVRWWRNFLSPWPVTVIKDDHAVQGTGRAVCDESDEICVRVTPSKHEAD